MPGKYQDTFLQSRVCGKSQNGLGRCGRELDGSIVGIARSTRNNSHRRRTPWLIWIVGHGAPINPTPTILVAVDLPASRSRLHESGRSVRVRRSSAAGERVPADTVCDEAWSRTMDLLPRSRNSPVAIHPRIEQSMVMISRRCYLVSECQDFLNQGLHITTIGSIASDGPAAASLGRCSCPFVAITRRPRHPHFSSLSP